MITMESFYDRNSVFSQLGFDTFTSLEYMNNVQYNDIRLADDSVLTQQIVEILNGSEGETSSIPYLFRDMAIILLIMR